MVLDVQQASLVADLGVAFVVDWAFLVDRVVGNEKGYWLSIDIVELVGNLAV